MVRNITPWRQKDPKQCGFRGSLRAYRLGAYSLGAYSLGAYSLGAYSLQATNSGSRQTLTGLGPTVWGPIVSGQPTVDPADHSLDWGPAVWSLQSGCLQSRGLQSLRLPPADPANHSLDWGPTVRGPTSGGLQSLGYRFWVSLCTQWTGGLQSVIKKNYRGPFNVDVVQGQAVTQIIFPGQF